MKSAREVVLPLSTSVRILESSVSSNMRVLESPSSSMEGPRVVPVTSMIRQEVRTATNIMLGFLCKVRETACHLTTRPLTTNYRNLGVEMASHPCPALGGQQLILVQIYITQTQ